MQPTSQSLRTGVPATGAPAPKKPKKKPRPSSKPETRPVRHGGYRTLALTRIRRRSPNPAFQLEVFPSKSAWRRSWMTIYLGSMATITQERIDVAVATLHARTALYREIYARTDRETALDSAEVHMLDVEPPANPDYPTRLQLNDVLCWTGISEGVTYLPKSDVDPGRTTPYSPACNKTQEET